MRRPVATALLCLSLVLLAFPLTLDKPGLPPNLKADEPAYYLMALSLARDGDLRLGVEDVDRLFREFPYARVQNLIAMSDDGWHTAYYGKPFAYSLFAAPFAGPFGADGLLLFNMVLLVAMMWMGATYLSRYNPDWLAAPFAAGFFLLSIAFAYGFWLQPEVFNMAAVTASLFLGFHRFERLGAGPKGALALAFLSGAALMPAVYNKPMIAALALPLVWMPMRERRWGRVVAWVLGAVVGLGAIAGLATALTGHPTPYLGVERQGLTVCAQGELPFEPVEAGPSTAVERSPTGGAWSWIFRVPRIEWRELTANLGYFLWGRHTGLALYMPFAVVALLLFLFHGRRSGARWLLLAGLGAVALFFLVFIPFNWQGGGGFVGNRYFVNVYPGFLFLVTRIRPRVLLPVGYAAGGVFLGAILLTPFGAAVPEPTLQFHTRNAPFERFPLELTLREVPGYHRVVIGDYQFIGRKDQVLPRGGNLWLRGSDRVELWLVGEKPIRRAVFQVRTPAPENRIRLEMGDQEEVLELDGRSPGRAVTRVTLEPGDSGLRGARGGGVPFVAHRLVVESEKGRTRPYTKHSPPNPCPGDTFGYTESVEETFLLGAELVYLGSAEDLERDVFHVAWHGVETRRRVVAGQTFYARVQLENASRAPWIASGAAAVRLAYHWLERPAPSDEPGEGREELRRPGRVGRMVIYDGLRTDLPLPVAPGQAVEVLQEIEAPEAPGRYVLEIDPVFEHVSWFSQRGAEPYRLDVTVVSAEAAEPAEPPEPPEPGKPGPSEPAAAGAAIAP